VVLDFKYPEPVTFRVILPVLPAPEFLTVKDWVTVLPTSMAPKLLLSGEMVRLPPSQIPLLQVGALLGQPALFSVQQAVALIHEDPQRLELAAQHSSLEQFPEAHSTGLSHTEPFAFLVPHAPLIQENPLAQSVSFVQEPALHALVLAQDMLFGQADEFSVAHVPEPLHCLDGV
jgi:hypothetical protein